MISFTFNVVYLPSVFQIISTQLLIEYICDILEYICDIPIHHKENKQAELTRPSLPEAELTQGPSWYQAELTRFLYNNKIKNIQVCQEYCTKRKSMIKIISLSYAKFVFKTHFGHRGAHWPSG